MFTFPFQPNFIKRFKLRKSSLDNEPKLGFCYYIPYDSDYPDRKVNNLEFYVGKSTFSILLPQIIKPAVIRRPNRSDIKMDRILGIVFHPSNVVIHHGVVNYYDRAGVKDKRKNIKFPWMQRVTVGLCMMDLLNGKLEVEFIGSGMNYTQYREKQEAIPALKYIVKDHDGEEAEMSVRVERHTVTKGVGWFKWTRWFRKPVVTTSLLIQFDKYLGTQKNSWKGGSKSATVELLPKETVDKAVERFLAEPSKFNFEFKSFTRV